MESITFQDAQGITQKLKANSFYNVDCMNVLRLMPDKYVDLAICDPPYGLKRHERIEESNRLCKNAKINKWDKKPDKKYFIELFRVTKNQIIFGANNFELPPSEYFIVWDKMQTVDNFASAEYAWTSIKIPAKVFRYSFLQCQEERKRSGKLNPCQKPEALYEWILARYAKPGDLILDTHVGSASSLIACHRANLPFVGFELDKHYYDLASKRLAEEMAQERLVFDTVDEPETEQSTIFDFIAV